MNITVTYSHNIPSWKTFRDYGVQQAYPTFTFSAEMYEYDRKSEDREDRDEKEAYRCAITLKIKGHYYCCDGCHFEIMSINVEVDGGEELSLLREDVRRSMSLRSIKQTLRGTLCEMFSDKIYDQLIDKV